MSQSDNSGFLSLPAGEAITQFMRVKKHTDGTAMIAGLAEKDIGTALETVATGAYVAIKLRTAAGTHKVIAKEALAIGATLYTEAGGKVQDTAEATSFQWGTALEAATADGDIIEALVNSHGDTAAS